MKKLLLGSVLSAGVKVTSAGLSFLMFLFLARVLGAEEYGHFGAMFALGTIGAITALFGQHTLSIKTLSALDDGPEAGNARRHSAKTGFAITLAGAGLFLLMLLVAGAAGAALGLDIGLRYLFGAASLVLPFALAELVSHQFRAFGAIFWALAPRDVLWRGAVVLGCVGAPAWPFLFADALTAMLAISSGLMLLVLAQLAAMMRMHGHLFVAAPGAQAEPPAVQWRVSAWMWLSSLGTMGASLNLIAATPFLSADQIGAYFAAQKTSQLLQLPIIAVNIAATPVFARLHNRRDTEALRNVGRKLALLIAAPLTLGALVIIFLAPELLALFDPTFATAAAALTVLAGSYLLIGLGGPTRQLMLMSDGERDVVRLTLLSEAVGLALVPVLVPLLGIVGAALAALAARAIFTVTTVMWCRARLGVDTSVLSLLPGARAPSG